MENYDNRVINKAFPAPTNSVHGRMYAGERRSIGTEEAGQNVLLLAVKMKL